MTHIFWKGKQWQCDSDGVYCESHDYFLAADRLGERGFGEREHMSDWVAHMAGKGWCDFDDFLAAFAIGIQVHGISKPFTPTEWINGLECAKKVQHENKVWNEVIKEEGLEHKPLRGSDLQRIGDIVDQRLGYTRTGVVAVFDKKGEG